MSEPMVTRSAQGIMTWWRRYTPSELREAWRTAGQGHDRAVQRGQHCVVLPCDDEALAVRLSARGMRVFAIRTCFHWDGRTFSVYCGDAGSGWRECMAHMRAALEHERDGLVPPDDPFPSVSLFGEQAPETPHE